MNRISLKNNIEKIRNNELFDLASKNKVFTAMIIFFIIGIFLGSAMVKFSSDKQIEDITSLFLSSVKNRAEGQFLNIFIKSLSSYFIFVLISFALGLTLWGFMVSFSVVFFRGFGLGVSAGYICMAYGFKGILFYLAILLPGIFLSSLAIILMVKESIAFSYKFFSASVLHKHAEIFSKLDLSIYIKRTGCILTMILAAALIDILFNYLFARFFVF